MAVIDDEAVYVKMANYHVAASPGILISSGLGSCVGVSLFDEEKKIGGLAHIMLPKAHRDVAAKHYTRYADTAIKFMLSEMAKMGCCRERFVAKYAGGSSMFPDLKKGEKGIGDRNIDAVIETLEMLDISIAASDTGGNYGRSIRFYTDSGEMRISTIRKKTILI